MALLLVLLAPACGGSPPAASPPANGALAFSRCMRSSGVASYPDPGGTAKPTLRALGVSAARFQSAEAACRHLLPNGGRPPNQADRRRARAQALAFSRCVRAHGVPHFPDPDSAGRIPDPASAGVDQGSPGFRAANDACAKNRPPYLPSNAAYDAWARTQGGGG